MLISLIARILKRLIGQDATLAALHAECKVLRSFLEGELSSQMLVLEEIRAAVAPGPAVGFVFDVMGGEFVSFEGDHMVLKDTEQVVLSVVPVDAKGNAAPVDGAPVWGSSDPAVATVTAAADGLSATVAAVGPLGKTQISVTADADLGEGLESIVGTLEIEVVAGKAVSLSIKTGTPEEIPAVQPDLQ
jgi:hypothetical protein